MQRSTAIGLGAGFFWLALFSLAFVAAPHSCEWGSTAYFLTGAIGLVMVFIASLAPDPRSPLFKRVVLGLVLALVTLIVWVAGLFLANVRILCRLF